MSDDDLLNDDIKDNLSKITPMQELACLDKIQTHTKQNAAPMGRVKSEWIAELFLQKLFVIIINSKVAELTAELCWLVPT